MKITEVSKRLNISCDTLRYYEKIGLIPTVTRNENGIRDYSDEDIKWAEFVKCMRGVGLSIESLKEYLILFHEGESTIPTRKEILLSERDKLGERIEEMKSIYNRLEQKIEVYESRLLEKEKELRR